MIYEQRECPPAGCMRRERERERERESKRIGNDQELIQSNATDSTSHLQNQRMDGWMDVGRTDGQTDIDR